MVACKSGGSCPGDESLLQHFNTVYLPQYLRMPGRNRSTTPVKVQQNICMHGALDIFVNFSILDENRLFTANYHRMLHFLRLAHRTSLWQSLNLKNALLFLPWPGQLSGHHSPCVTLTHPA